MDKSIDLGKLQSDLISARANLRAANREVTKAWSAFERAQAIVDRANEKACQAEKTVDMARKAVLQATRTVAAS